MKSLIVAVIFILLSTGAVAYVYPKEFEKPWDHSPITFRLNLTFPPECDPLYTGDVLKAIEYWKSGGNGRLSFVPEFKEVRIGETADIEVRWVKTVANISEEVGGVANIAVIPAKKFVSAKIQLACGGYFKTREGEIYKTFSHRELETTATHELGHALGLDHTDDPYDIMTPRQTIQIIPASFETSSYGMNISFTPRKTMAGEAVEIEGKTGPNIKLDFFDLSENISSVFSREKIVSDERGYFKNFVFFGKPGRYLIEVVSTLNPQIYASAVIFVERGVDIQINSQIPAEIFVNGTSFGAAPKKLENLKYGTYEILCRAEGYEDSVAYVTIGPNTGNELKAEPSRDAILCLMEKPGQAEKKKGFIEKFLFAVGEFFRILFS